MRPFLRQRLFRPQGPRYAGRPATRNLHAPTNITETASATAPFTASIDASTINLSRSNLQSHHDNLAFDSRYLRDWCTCASCRHPDTNQRLLDTFSLPTDLHAKSLEPSASGLRVTWSDQSAPDGENHQSLYTWSWLQSHSQSQPSPSPSTTTSGTPSRRPIYWTSTIANNEPTVPYASIMDPSSASGLRAWVNNIRTHGFSYVSDCPVDPATTQRLVERIAFIRPTHYGGFWDFTADLASRDTAYTTLELPVHTDTTYFSDPAGLQMFHLLSHAGGTGGESLLTDGFGAADELAARDPAAARVLEEVRITAHATGNDDAKIITSQPFPVIQREGPEGRLVKIRWNNDDRGSFAPGTSREDVGRWYEAARKFKDILEDPKYKYRSQLKPGRPLIFDNWRVLHGRTAFDGKRRLCGAYVNMDDFLSRWRTLNMASEEIAASI